MRNDRGARGVVKNILICLTCLMDDPLLEKVGEFSKYVRIVMNDL